MSNETKEEKIEAFIEKWNVGFEDKEQKEEFAIEMRTEIMEILTPPNNNH